MMRRAMMITQRPIETQKKRFSWDEAAVTAGGLFGTAEGGFGSSTDGVAAGGGVTAPLARASQFHSFTFCAKCFTFSQAHCAVVQASSLLCTATVSDGVRCFLPFRTKIVPGTT